MATTPVSPKVTSGAAVAAIVGLLLQVANSITPDTFAFLGKGQGLAFMVVTLGLGALAAWRKTDPLRVVPDTPPVPVSLSLAKVLPAADVVEVEPVVSVPTVIRVDEPTDTPSGAHAA